MADPQNRLRVAQEFINFGTKASNTGLSYLKAQQRQDEIDEGDRVAKAKVLKEKLAAAEMVGRQIAASNPKMSIVSQVLAMQRNVGLTEDNPNFQKIIDATNEGFLLKRAEVGLSRYNAELKSTAPLAAEELYQNFLIESTPSGEDDQEVFNGTLIQYAAEHIEELRIATIGTLVEKNKGRNRFSVILSKPGNRLNYDALKNEIAKKQANLDEQALYRDAIKNVKEEIKEIVIQGTTTDGGDPMVLGTVQHTSGQSLKHIIQSLKDRGLENVEVNDIIFTSLRSGLETQVEEEGIKLLGTNYFDNIVELLHSKKSDPEGISLYEKDKVAGQQLLTKVREYEKKLEDEFELGTKKTTKTTEEVLANDATKALEKVIEVATTENENGTTPSASAIQKLINNIYANQSKGDTYGGIIHMDDTIFSKIMNHLEELRKSAEQDEKKDLDDNENKVIGTAYQDIEKTEKVLTNISFLSLTKTSTNSQFETELDKLIAAEQELENLGSDVGNNIGYGWAGSATFQSKISTLQDKLSEAKKTIFKLKSEGLDKTSQEGISSRLEIETNEYNSKIVRIKQRDEPKLSTLFFQMKELSTNVEDTKLYKENIKTYTDIVNQTERKPIGLNKLSTKILYGEVFVFNEQTRSSFRNQLNVIEKAREDEDKENKIIINPQGERDFRVKISRSIGTISENSESLNFEERSEALKGLLTNAQDAFSTDKIGLSVFQSIEKQLTVGITNIKSLVDKNYGSIKIFDDSKKKLNFSIIGQVGEGIVLPMVNLSRQRVYGVFEEEHNRLQDYLIDVSENFDQRKLILETPTSKQKTVSQARMFSSGVSIYNKRIRNLAFLTHRNLMFGILSPEQALANADKMEGTGKWSEEEIQIIREVAGFESYPGAIGHLREGYKNLNLAGNSNWSNLYYNRNTLQEVIPPDDATPSEVPSGQSLIDAITISTSTSGGTLNINTEVESESETDMSTTEEIQTNIEIPDDDTFTGEETFDTLLAPEPQ